MKKMVYNWLLYSKTELTDLFKLPLGQQGKFNSVNENVVHVEHDLLICDCQSYPVNEFAALIIDLKKMLNVNRPVLLINPTIAHKQELIRTSVIPACILGNSLALFIEPRRDKQGDLKIALAEHFGACSDGYVERSLTSLDAKGKTTRNKIDKFSVSKQVELTINDVLPFINRMRHGIHMLSAGKVIRATANEDEVPNTPPSNLPDQLWTNTPINIYQTINPCGSSGDSGFTPPTGNITLQALVSVGAYYDNKKYSNPVQWLYIEHSGHLTTVMNVNNSDQRGWSLGHLTIDGDNISSAQMVSNQSKPNNVNEQSQYTTSTEFGVGVSAGTEGISSDINYSIGSSQTCNISDWKIVQNDENSWLFDQQKPFDGTDAPFPDGAADNDGVKGLPTISTSTLAFNTQTVWIQNPARTNVLNVNYGYEVASYFTWCDQHDSTSWHAWNWRYTSKIYRTFCINFGLAYPS